MKNMEQKLCVAMCILLKSRRLEEIWVHDICAEAQTVRAVFYAYFADKYDLHNHCRRMVEG